MRCKPAPLPPKKRRLYRRHQIRLFSRTGGFLLPTLPVLSLLFSIAVLSLLAPIAATHPAPLLSHPLRPPPLPHHTADTKTSRATHSATTLPLLSLPPDYSLPCISPLPRLIASPSLPPLPIPLYHSAHHRHAVTPPTPLPPAGTFHHKKTITLYKSLQTWHNHRHKIVLRSVPHG